MSGPLLPGVEHRAEVPEPAEPSTAARPAAPGARPATGPELPVVQRQTAAPGSDGALTGGGSPAGPAAAVEKDGPPHRARSATPSGARARGGLGAPLPALPPTASPRGPAPARPDGRHAAAPLLGARPETDSPAPTGVSPSGAGVVRPPAPALLPRLAPPSNGDAPRTSGPDRAAAARPAARKSPTASAGAGPVVVARALARTRPAEPASAPALSLLAARPLALNTRVPDGLPRPRQDAPARPPVVAASWRREPPPPAPHAPVRRASSAPGPSATAARTEVPVVRPVAPVQRAASAAAPGTRMPVLPLAEAQAPPLQGAPAPQHAPGPPVPVVRAGRPAQSEPVPPGAVPAQVVQRDVTKAAGGGRPRSVSAPPSFPAAATGPDVRQEAAPHEAPAIDLEDLARRLLDPLSRLLRADLRRGRERAGRPYDGRR
ncbi:hypothetical protein [Streptomyces misionensis]|uniref:hypothetical protein n=1 Tax=Streptomyces misionensis TaxID=67331 RepID=UPI00368A2257